MYARELFSTFVRRAFRPESNSPSTSSVVPITIQRLLRDCSIHRALYIIFSTIEPRFLLASPNAIYFLVNVSYVSDFKTISKELGAYARPFLSNLFTRRESLFGLYPFYLELDKHSPSDL